MTTEEKAEIRASLGAQVRAARESAGLSMRDLAEISGQNHNNISRIEAGRYNFTIDSLTAIARALHTEFTIK